GGISYYAPVAVFYEFGPLIFALLGLIGVLAFQIRSRLAAVAMLWALFATAFVLANPLRAEDWLIMMIVPLALLGAAGIDWLHHLRIWNALRYPIALIAILTLYVQLAATFVHYAPDPTEAAWSKHMLLFWTEPATSIQAEQELRHAQRMVGDRGIAFF